MWKLFKKYLLLAASGLSCSTWDICCGREGSVGAVCHLSCPAAWGVLVPKQGWSLCGLHWKADSQPLDSQGSPSNMETF